MTFSDQIKERKEIHMTAVGIHGASVNSVFECFEYRIMELESDLDNAREDLENEKALTKKLKGLLDGGLVELVGELVEALEAYVRFCDDCTALDILDTGDCMEMNHANTISLAVLTKAKEAMSRETLTLHGRLK